MAWVSTDAGETANTPTVRASTPPSIRPVYTPQGISAHRRRLARQAVLPSELVTVSAPWIRPIRGSMATEEIGPQIAQIQSATREAVDAIGGRIQADRVRSLAKRIHEYTGQDAPSA
jgi:hypothetical protein